MTYYEAMVMGVSAGGLRILSTLIPSLPYPYPLPLLIVQHRAPDTDDFLARHLDQLSRCRVKEAEHGEALCSGTVFLAPAGHHLVTIEDRTLRCTSDPPVHFARPSIDVLFSSAAAIFGPCLIGILLSGGNSDGVEGIRRIKSGGGLTIVQRPDSAAVGLLPRLAIESVNVDHVLEPGAIAAFMKKLGEKVERVSYVL